MHLDTTDRECDWDPIYGIVPTHSVFGTTACCEQCSKHCAQTRAPGDIFGLAGVWRVDNRSVHFTLSVEPHVFTLQNVSKTPLVSTCTSFPLPSPTSCGAATAGALGVGAFAGVAAGAPLAFAAT